MKIVIILCVLAAFILSTTAWAGTWRDDFENKQDFPKDKQEGVWEEDIAFFEWEGGTVKGVEHTGDVRAIITGNYGWEDYTIECRIKPLQESGYVGLALRRPCTFCNPCYVFVLSLWQNEAAIYLNFFQKLDSSSFKAKIDTWYSLKAIAKGKQLEFYIDNKLVVKVEDSTHQAGKAGPYVDDSEALFDDFVMTGPEVKDGGHWDPKAHPQPKPVEPQNKLEMTWGEIKRGR